ncbi:hypothetical protein LXA43DRAFT_33054 [Ganoderma leucocontextum]|nr:hypothetical protein LXA43DRAFT_33054 [Ganoderma leucocontextum]
MHSPPACGCRRLAAAHEELPYGRIQGLALDTVIADETLYSAQIDYLRPCQICGTPNDVLCPHCFSRLAARCSICRLTIKGLYHVCSRCLHVSHLKCWRGREDAVCASGCGCACALPAHFIMRNVRGHGRKSLAWPSLSSAEGLAGCRSGSSVVMQ